MTAESTVGVPVFLFLGAAPALAGPIWPARWEPAGHSSDARPGLLPAAGKRACLAPSCPGPFLPAPQPPFLPLASADTGGQIASAPKGQGGCGPCAICGDPGLCGQPPRRLLTRRQRDEHFQQNSDRQDFLCVLPPPAPATRQVVDFL